MKVVKLTEWEDLETSRDVYYCVSDDDFQKIKHLNIAKENNQISPKDFLSQIQAILVSGSIIKHDMEADYCLK